ncbi:E3 ubiquitin-protein ligase Os04g0590900 [Linum perenne]
MASAIPANTRIRFMNKNDCPSQGPCSLHCPQLCLKLIFPSSSPPPPPTPTPHSHRFSVSTTSFSPIVIAIIAILASALLLLSYYTLISKYCRRHNSRSTIQDDPTRRRRMRRQNNVIHDQTIGNELDADVMNSSFHEPWQWHVSLTTGLDESLIKSITACKYRKDEGLVGEGTEHCCSVCLGEFREGESLRLLPKCNHAFHLDCIDTWLATHSTCPLCRANIFFFGTDDHPASVPDTTHDNTETVRISVQQGAEMNNGIGIEERNDRHQRAVRRCVSMDHLCRQTNNNSRHVSGVGSESRVAEEQEEEEEESKHGSCSNRRLMDNLKRSFSSGRLFYLSRHRNRLCQHPNTLPSTSNV